jgi:hypothetical protein
MGFTTIIPVPKAATGIFKISTVCMRKGGDFKLQISMPSAQFTNYFGTAEKLTVQIGTGADQGKMQILCDGNGAFKPRLMKHAALIRFGVLDFVPQLQMLTEKPEVRRVTVDAASGIVIDLPEWVWNKDRQEAIAKARGQVARERKSDANAR